ncbi:unnamed protein product, partial [Musa textilis]
VSAVAALLLNGDEKVAQIGLRLRRHSFPPLVLPNYLLQFWHPPHRKPSKVWAPLHLNVLQARQVLRLADAPQPVQVAQHHRSQLRKPIPSLFTCFDTLLLHFGYAVGSRGSPITPLVYDLFQSVALGDDEPLEGFQA